MLKRKTFTLRCYTTLTENNKEYKTIKTYTSKYTFRNNVSGKWWITLLINESKITVSFGVRLYLLILMYQTIKRFNNSYENPEIHVNTHKCIFKFHVIYIIQDNSMEDMINFPENLLCNLRVGLSPWSCLRGM